MCHKRECKYIFHRIYRDYCTLATRKSVSLYIYVYYIYTIYFTPTFVVVVTTR